MQRATVRESRQRSTGEVDLKAVALVSDDVDIEDNVELIWGIFTRFDCALDVVFSESAFRRYNARLQWCDGNRCDMEAGVSEAVGDGSGHCADSGSEVGGPLLGLNAKRRYD